MVSKSLPLKLPIVDFSGEDQIPGTGEWNSMKAKVLVALSEYGCFEALFDKVPDEIQNSIYPQVKKLFDLPSEVKRGKLSEKPFKGYIDNFPKMPLFECMSLKDAHKLENIETFSNTFWPQGNSSFSETIQSFSNEVAKLDQTIRRMILESFGLEKYIDEHMKSTYYDTRINKYRAPKSTDHDASEIGSYSHRDSVIMAVLKQINHVDGLEVKTKDGDWIQVKPSSPNSYIVIIGDSLYAWLNGRLRAPCHRVIMSGSEARYSVVLFTVPKDGYIVKAPEELVDEEHPLLFKPFDFADLLKFLRTEVAQGVESRLEIYCGL